MKASYSEERKSSIMEAVGFDDLERVEFIKRGEDIKDKDLIGCAVCGILYIKQKKNMRSDSTSLCIIDKKERPYLLTIPTWFGKRIMEDFNEDPEVDAETYFKGVTIASVRDIDTPNGATFALEFDVPEA